MSTQTEAPEWGSLFTLQRRIGGKRPVEALPAAPSMPEPDSHRRSRARLRGIATICFRGRARR